MAFLSFLRKAISPAVTDTPLLTEKAIPDAINTELVMDMLKTPPQYRDRHWEQSFYDYVSTAAFAYNFPEVTCSQEGYSFIDLQAPPPGHSSAVYCLKNLISDTLLVKGYGVCIHSSSNEILWEFSYGDLLNFYLHHEFITKQPSDAIQHIDMTKRVQVLKKDDEVMMAQPSEKYLPREARNAIKKFLNEAGIAKPGIMLFCRKLNNEFIQQLAFHLTADQSRPAQYDSIMQKLTWYLPRHYSAISFREGSDTLKYFQPL